VDPVRVFLVSDEEARPALCPGGGKRVVIGFDDVLTDARVLHRLGDRFLGSSPAASQRGEERNTPSDRPALYGRGDSSSGRRWARADRNQTREQEIRGARGSRLLLPDSLLRAPQR